MAYSRGSSNGVALWMKLAGLSLLVAGMLVAAATYFRSPISPKEQAAPVAVPPDARAVSSDPRMVPGEPHDSSNRSQAKPDEPRIARSNNRAVSSEQQAALSMEISVKGMKLAILKYNDKEAAAYANQLIEAFRNSGAQVQTLVVGMSDDPAAGIVLDRNGGETDRIAAYLAKARIPFTIGQAASVPSSARVAFSGVPIVVVGLKP